MHSSLLYHPHGVPIFPRDRQKKNKENHPKETEAKRGFIGGILRQNSPPAMVQNMCFVYIVV